MRELNEIPLEIGGGMWDAGDGNKAPNSTTRKQSNLTNKAGSLVKRKAFRFDQTVAASIATSEANIDSVVGSFGVRKAEATESLFFSFRDSAGRIKASELTGGAWTTRIDKTIADLNLVGGPTGKLRLHPLRDSIVMYSKGMPCLVYNSLGTGVGFSNSTNGSIPFYTGCSCFAVYFQRIMMANLTVSTPAILGLEDGANNAWPSQWAYDTNSGAFVATSNVTINSEFVTIGGINYHRRWLTVTGANPTIWWPFIDRNNSFDPAFAAKEFPVRGSVDLRVDQSGAAGVPITVEFVKSDGTVIYSAREYLLPAASETSSWGNYQATGTIPASTNFYLRLKLYNSTGTAAVGDKISYVNRLPEQGRTRGPFATAGHHAYLNPNFYVTPDPFAGYHTPADGSTTAIWSDIGDASNWSGAAFYKPLEKPGEITGIHAIEKQFLITKENAVWWFGYSTDPDIAIQLENYSAEVGATTQESVVVYNGRVFCVNKEGLFNISPGSLPSLIVHDGMRKNVFEDNTPPRMLTVDRKRGILYLASTTKLWAMDIETSAWSEVALPAGILIGAIHWGKYDNDTEGVLRIAYLLPVGGGNFNINIGSLSGDGNKDSATGVEVDVVSEYIFHTIQTPSPLKVILVHFLEIDHEITSSNVNDVFSLALSEDDGVTWSVLGNYNISQITSGADTQVLSFPVNRAVKRGLFRIKHTGRGGEAAFNFNGARLLVTGLGRAHNPRTPTAV